MRLSGGCSLVLLAAATGVAGCRKPSGSPEVVSQPPRPADSVEGAGPAESGAADVPQSAGDGEPRAPVTLSGPGDALDPAIVAAGGGWVVAWMDDGPAGSRLLAAAVRGDARPAEPRPVSEGPADAGVRLAAVGDRVLAVWHSAEGGGAARARLLDSEASALTAVSTLSGDGVVGPPEVIATDGGFVAAWIAGGDIAAALIDKEGAVVGTGRWNGGGPRPPDHRLMGAAPPNPSADPEYGKPDALRPTLRVVDGMVQAFWKGDVWQSDDQIGPGRYLGRLDWNDQERSPEALQTFYGVAVFDAFVLDSGESVQLEQWHESGEDSWELHVRGADGAQKLVEEPVGPLRAVMAPVSGDSLAVAWLSPTHRGYRFLVGKRGAMVGTIVPSSCPTGFGSAALGVRRPAAGSGLPVLRAAVVDSDHGRAVVRVVDPASFGGELPAGAPTPPFDVFRETRGSPWSLSVARTAAGALGVVWGDGMQGKRVRAMWITEGDDGVDPAEPAVDVSDPELQCHGATAVADGDSVLAAFTCCPPGDFCSDPRAYAAVLKPGSAPEVTAVTAEGPAFDVGAVVRSGEHAAIAMLRHDDYHSRLVVRRADGDTPADAIRALAGAEGVEIPESEGDHQRGISGVFVGDTLVLAFANPQYETDDYCQVVRVGADGTPELAARFAEPGGIHSPSRLVLVGDRLALLGTRSRAGEIDLALLWLDSRGERAEGTTLLARDVEPHGPYLAVRDGAVAASWCDARTEGAWLAFVGLDGRRLADPIRIDAPGARASTGISAVVPWHAEGTWRAFWSSPWDGAYALHTGRYGQ